MQLADGPRGVLQEQVERVVGRGGERVALEDDVADVGEEHPRRVGAAGEVARRSRRSARRCTTAAGTSSRLTAPVVAPAASQRGRGAGRVLCRNSTTSAAQPLARSERRKGRTSAASYPPTMPRTRSGMAALQVARDGVAHRSATTARAGLLHHEVDLAVVAVAAHARGDPARAAGRGLAGYVETLVITRIW